MNMLNRLVSLSPGHNMVYCLQWCGYTRGTTYVDPLDTKGRVLKPRLPLVVFP